MPIRNQGEFFVDPKEVEQDIALEVSPTTEIPKEVDKSLDECKKVGHDKLFEVSPPMEDIPHHGTSIRHSLENPFMQRVLEMKSLIFFLSSYHLLSARGRNVFPKICQISSPIVL